MTDHIKGVGQRHDRVAHELPGAVPSDLSAAVDVEHGRPVHRALATLGPPAGGVDARVLKQQQRVRDLVGQPPRGEFPLQSPRLLVGQEAEVLDVHTSSVRRSEARLRRRPAARYAPPRRSTALTSRLRNVAGPSPSAAICWANSWVSGRFEFSIADS